MTETEVIYTVIDSVTSQEGVTNLPLSEEAVGDEVDTFRARIIDELDSKGLFRRPFANYAQTLDVDIKNGKSVTPLPKVISLKGSVPAIAYIGQDLTSTADPKNGSSVYRIALSRGDVEGMKHNKFLHDVPIALLEDGYLYIFKKSVNKVTISAVFEDPSDLEIFGAYNRDVSEYPMSAGQIDILKGKLIESYLRTLNRLPVQPNTQSNTLANEGPDNKRVRR